MAKNPVEMLMKAQLAGEPVFLLRAKDIFSSDVLAYYITQVATRGPSNPDMTQDLDGLLHQFGRWQQDHPNEVRYPD